MPTEMVWAQTNPMLDTMVYQIEFAGAKLQKLTTNVIVESMYT